MKKPIFAQDGEIAVSKIQFTDDTKLGSHALDFVYRDKLKATMMIELIHGIPDKLVWVIDPPMKDSRGIYPVVKDSKVSLQFQLQDKFNNNCHQDEIEIQLGTSNKLIFKDKNGALLPKRAKTDKNGIADYGMFIVAINSEKAPFPEPCTLNPMPCKGKCYGFLPVQAEATFEVYDGITRNILSEKIHFHVKCDNTIPIGIEIKCNSIDAENKFFNRHIVAGSKLPMFKVGAIAEDTFPVLDLGPNGIVMETMLIGRNETKNQTPTPLLDAESGVYTFDLHSPPTVGSYSLKFLHQPFGSSVPLLVSDPIFFKVVPSVPAVFQPLEPKPMQWVSNTSVQSSRTIVSNLHFVLVDKFKNAVAPARNPGEGDMDEDDKYSGTLTAQIFGLHNEPIDTLPKFTGRVRFLTFPIVNGECKITYLELAKNSPGEDGNKYKITFTPKFNIPIVVKTTSVPEEGEEAIETEVPLKNYEITFGFVNDVAKQGKMRALTNRMSDVQRKLNLIFVTRAKIEKVTKMHRECFEKVDRDLNNLITRNRSILEETIDENSAPETIRDLIRIKSGQLEDAREGSNSSNSQLPRFVIAPAPTEPDVVGKIVHLVKVESVEASRVLSWHVRGDLNCIVTNTTEKAKELDKRFNHSQQVWPMDSIPVRFKNFEQEKVPLPHTRCTEPFDVTGNPRWALSLVTFDPKTEHVARIVLNQMLGNLLIMDTMDDATNYRAQCTRQKVEVGTILTLRDARRLSAMGKFWWSWEQCTTSDQTRRVSFTSPLIQKLLISRVVRQSIYGYPYMEIHMDILWIFMSPKRLSMDFLFCNRNFQDFCVKYLNAEVTENVFSWISSNFNRHYEIRALILHLVFIKVEEKKRQQKFGNLNWWLIRQLTNFGLYFQ